MIVGLDSQAVLPVDSVIGVRDGELVGIERSEVDGKTRDIGEVERRRRATRLNRSGSKDNPKENVACPRHLRDCCEVVLAGTKGLPVGVLGCSCWPNIRDSPRLRSRTFALFNAMYACAATIEVGDLADDSVRGKETLLVADQQVCEPLRQSPRMPFTQSATVLVGHLRE